MNVEFAVGAGGGKSGADAKVAQSAPCPRPPDSSQQRQHGRGQGECRQHGKAATATATATTKAKVSHMSQGRHRHRHHRRHRRDHGDAAAGASVEAGAKGAERDAEGDGGVERGAAEGIGKARHDAVEVVAAAPENGIDEGSHSTAAAAAAAKSAGASGAEAGVGADGTSRCAASLPKQPPPPPPGTAPGYFNTRIPRAQRRPPWTPGGGGRGGEARRSPVVVGGSGAAFRAHPLPTHYTYPYDRRYRHELVLLGCSSDSNRNVVQRVGSSWDPLESSGSPSVQRGAQAFGLAAEQGIASGTGMTAADDYARQTFVVSESENRIGWVLQEGENRIGLKELSAITAVGKGATNDGGDGDFNAVDDDGGDADADGGGAEKGEKSSSAAQNERSGGDADADNDDKERGVKSEKSASPEIKIVHAFPPSAVPMAAAGTEDAASGLDEDGGEERRDEKASFLIDVDGPYVAVKDVRRVRSSSFLLEPSLTSATSMSETFELFIARRRRRRHTAAMVAFAGREGNIGNGHGMVVGHGVAGAASPRQGRGALPPISANGGGGRTAAATAGMADLDLSAEGSPGVDRSRRVPFAAPPVAGGERQGAIEEEEGGYDTDDENDYAIGLRSGVRGKSPAHRECEDGGYYAMEPLPRRQMRVLHRGDRIIVRMTQKWRQRTRDGDGDGPVVNSPSEAEWAAETGGSGVGKEKGIGDRGGGVCGDGSIVAKRTLVRFEYRHTRIEKDRYGGVDEDLASVEVDSSGVVAGADAFAAPVEEAKKLLPSAVSPKFPSTATAGPAKMKFPDDVEVSKTGAAAAHKPASSGCGPRDTCAAKKGANDAAGDNASVAAAAVAAAAATVAAAAATANDMIQAAAAVAAVGAVNSPPPVPAPQLQPAVVPSATIPGRSKEAYFPSRQHPPIIQPQAQQVPSPLNVDNIAEAGPNPDDDDEMEEYSYLTGEVIMKDQGYVSAITGDDETDVDGPGGGAIGDVWTDQKRRSCAISNRVEAANRAYGLDVMGDSARAASLHAGGIGVVATTGGAAAAGELTDCGVGAAAAGGGYRLDSIAPTPAPVASSLAEAEGTGTALPRHPLRPLEVEDDAATASAVVLGASTGISCGGGGGDGAMVGGVVKFRSAIGGLPPRMIEYMNPPAFLPPPAPLYASNIGNGGGGGCSRRKSGGDDADAAIDDPREKHVSIKSDAEVVGKSSDEDEKDETREDSPSKYIESEKKEQVQDVGKFGNLQVINRNSAAARSLGTPQGTSAHTAVEHRNENDHATGDGCGREKDVAATCGEVNDESHDGVEADIDDDDDETGDEDIEGIPTQSYPCPDSSVVAEDDRSSDSTVQDNATEGSLLISKGAFVAQSVNDGTDDGAEERSHFYETPTQRFVPGASEFDDEEGSLNAATQPLGQPDKTSRGKKDNDDAPTQPSLQATKSEVELLGASPASPDDRGKGKTLQPRPSQGQEDKAIHSKPQSDENILVAVAAHGEGNAGDDRGSITSDGESSHALLDKVPSESGKKNPAITGEPPSSQMGDAFSRADVESMPTDAAVVAPRRRSEPEILLASHKRQPESETTGIDAILQERLGLTEGEKECGDGDNKEVLDALECAATQKGAVTNETLTPSSFRVWECTMDSKRAAANEQHPPFSTVDVVQTDVKHLGGVEVGRSLHTPRKTVKEMPSASDRAGSKKLTTATGSGNNYSISFLQNQAGGNNVVHRVSSGAIMTGPVGSVLPRPPSGPTQVRMDHLPISMVGNMLTAFALMSNEMSGKPGQPESSEETTVCQASISGADPESANGDTKAPEPGKSVGKRNQEQTGGSLREKMIAPPTVSTKLPQSSDKERPRTRTRKRLMKETTATKPSPAATASDSQNALTVAEPSFPLFDSGEGIAMVETTGNDVKPSTLPDISASVSKTPTWTLGTSQKRRRFADGMSDSSEPPQGWEEPGKENIRIMFTGIQVTSKDRKMIESIGGVLLESVEEASSATHVIVGDGKTALRRTPKLMICVCCTSNILNMKWLVDSAKEGKPLDCRTYLLLNDQDAERKYGFVMRETLRNGELVRRERGGLLSGRYVYFCKGVADCKAPSAHELNLIVCAAGGEVLKSLSVSATKKVDTSKVIIITSDPATSAQSGAKDVIRMASLGSKVFTTSWLFHCIITQTIPNPDEVATEINTAEYPSTPLQSGRKRKASPESVRRSSRRRR